MSCPGRRAQSNHLPHIHQCEPTAIESKEAFSAYMHDLYSTRDGNLDFGGFVAYRINTEREYPLAKDLAALGYSLLSGIAAEYRRVASIFDAFDVNGMYFSPTPVPVEVCYSLRCHRR